MPRVRSGVIAVLDIGSYKIACFIAQITNDNRLKIIGIGHQLSQGIKSGAITDMRLAENSIIAAVTAAEKMAGEVIDKVVVCNAGGNPNSNKLSAEVEVSGGQVSPRDVKRGIISAKEFFNDEKRRVVHAVPVSFTVDDIRGVDDPVGMSGDLLTADVNLITISESAFKNTANCVGNCQLDIQDYVVSSHAAGLTCLTDDERDLGVTVVEMGGGSTGISVFAHGKNVFTDSVPYGGMHITADIAKGLSTTLECAERIKTLYGSAISGSNDNDTMIDVPQINDQSGAYSEEVVIPKSKLVGIIQPRLEEIFDMVRDKLRSSPMSALAEQQIVLSGGASQLMGVREFASKFFGGHVRLGRPEFIEGMADSTSNPSFAAAAGLINYISMNYHVYDKVVPVNKYLQNTRTHSGGGEGVIGGLFNWVKNNF